MSVIIGYDAETQKPITLSDSARSAGLYILGRSGMGKTVLLTNILMQDMNKNGFLCIDPHGDITKKLKDYPPVQIQNCALINPQSERYTFGINLLSCSDITNLNAREDTYLRVYNAFARIWEKDFREHPWLQLFIQNTIRAFIENQNYTLAEVPMFLTQKYKDFREHIVSNISQNTRVADFWYTEFTLPEREQRERMGAALTRVETLLGHENIYQIVGQKETTINFTRVIEEGNSIILNLSANLSLDQKRFLSTIILSELLNAVRKRNIQNPKLFSVYIDEAQHFVYSEDFSTLFTEARKFGIATTIAHQERYGQLADNRKVAGATLAAVNKVCFQLSSPDAVELAPEFAERVQATETHREPVLLPSPHVLEDIWDRGHANEHVRDLRMRYFWLVDFLRKNPQAKYFAFDPRNAFFAHDDHTGKLHADQFEDWGMYRSSAEMLKTGISLLNQYYYDWMIGKYNRDQPVTEQEIQLFLKIIECIGGVLGFRPAMTAYLPPEKCELILRALDDQQIKGLNEMLSSVERPRLDHDPWFARDHPGSWQAIEGAYKRHLEEDRNWRENIERKINSLRLREVNNKPIYFTARKVDRLLAIAVRQGISTHEAENLVEWDMREPISTERQALTEIVKGMLNCRMRNKNQVDIEGALEQYRTILSHITLMDILGENYLDLPRDVIEKNIPLVVDRIIWQVYEMGGFIVECSFLLGYELQQRPLKVPSGRYDESTRVERTQTDLNVDMARELMRLDKFKAYTKYMQENGKMWSGRMIERLPEPFEESFHDVFRYIRPYERGEKLYCRKRTEIEQEIRERQKRWRNTDKEEFALKPGAVLTMSKKNEPPPRRS